MRNTGLPFAIAMGVLGISKHSSVLPASLGAITAGSLFGGMMALVSWRAERRLIRDGFSFTDLKPTQQREVRSNISLPTAFTLATEALHSVRKLKILSRDSITGTIAAKAGMTFHSSGETVAVTITANKEGCLVTIRSEPRFASTPMDGGKGIENVETFVRTFIALLAKRANT
jgi:hypothetical protein